MELLCDGGTKVCSNGPGYMTKLAAMPKYGKTFKNLLLQNRMAEINERSSDGRRYVNAYGFGKK